MNVEWSEEATSQLEAIRDYLARASHCPARLPVDR
jgi:plasmid stabilization system protein ParE